MESNHIKVTLRDPEHYPPELKHLLDIITINEVPKVVGSYAYTSHKYPSDVDVFERVTLNVSKQQAAVTYANHFKNIAQKLLIMSNNVFINDFKSGAFNGEPLRWTAKQIIDGVYILPTGKKVQLTEALSQEEITKLDVIAYIGGKFQSVEVFYNLRFTEQPPGSEVGVEYDFYPMGSYVKSLLNDVEKYASKELYTPLKLAKRLWSLSRITDCSDLFNLLDPLMSSNAASLNQIKSDIEVVKDLLFNIQFIVKNSKLLSLVVELNRGIEYTQNIDLIHLQILQLYKRLSNHMDAEKLRGVPALFDIIFNEWVEYSKSAQLNMQVIDDTLDLIVKLLKEQINTESEEYLQLVLNIGTFCKVNYNQYINI